VLTRISGGFSRVHAPEYKEMNWWELKQIVSLATKLRHGEWHEIGVLSCACCKKLKGNKIVIN